MCVKFILRDLNPDFYPLHFISIYTCGVTIAPKVRGFFLEMLGARTQ